MYVSDLNIPPGTIGDAALQIIDWAAQMSRRCEHATVTSEHLFVAVAHVDWSLFRDVLRGVGVNHNAVLAAVEEHLRLMPSGGGESEASPTAKLVCQRAVQHATRAGRQAVASTDLLLALFDGRRGVTASIFRQQGVDPGVVMTRLQARARELELRLDSGNRARLSSVA